MTKKEPRQFIVDIENVPDIINAKSYTEARGIINGLIGLSEIDSNGEIIEVFDDRYYIFIDGKKSKYKSTSKEDLEIELKDLLEHEDNKDWVKNKSFEIRFTKCLKCKVKEPCEYEEIGEGKYCRECLDEENKIFDKECNISEVFEEVKQ